jgi:hypothetical protein
VDEKSFNYFGSYIRVEHDVVVTIKGTSEMRVEKIWVDLYVFLC